LAAYPQNMHSGVGLEAGHIEGVDRVGVLPVPVQQEAADSVGDEVHSAQDPAGDVSADLNFNAAKLNDDGDEVQHRCYAGV